jgi:hypothetical protein
VEGRKQATRSLHTNAASLGRSSASMPAEEVRAWSSIRFFFRGHSNVPLFIIPDLLVSRNKLVHAKARLHVTHPC